MPLAWNEIRQRAISFARDWSDASRERAEAQTFWNEFFRVFDIARRTVASFEEPVRNLSGGFDFIDLFWKGRLIAEHKSRGGNLSRAHSQAIDYIQSLHTEGRSEEVPRYVIVSDFAQIALHDLESEDPAHQTIQFPLEALSEHIRHFAFMAGYETRRLDEEDPANFKATELLANLHDRLEEGGYTGHDLQRFMVRILFCLFAEDTGIFEPESFTLYIRNRTREDGSDTGAQLSRMFEVLNTPADRRQANLDEDLASLPYVNGDLFAERLRFPDFNSAMRTALLICCNFRWERISPAVFGSLFQNIMQERRQIGAHYTSERDIMKLIRSLFLDELRAEFESIRRDRRALERLHRRLGAMRFLDPACGCGNFLVLAYRELRRLEMDVIQTRFGDNPSEGDIRAEARLNVSQFYGIEIEGWPVRIAEVAMWLMDHQMNNELFERFSQIKPTTPLTRSPHIIQANALRIDWNEVLPPEECTYVFGNPPFVGKKEQNAEQKEDMSLVWGDTPSAGILDYVTCWYRKAVTYMAGRSIRAAFVSTNSITHGEQPGVLWPALRRAGNIFLRFAHTTFSWVSEARGRAHVHVVILGFAAEDQPDKRIFVYEDIDGEPTMVRGRNINCYLADATDVVITNRSRAICDVPQMLYGSMMIDKDRRAGDDAGLILTSDHRDAIIAETPALAGYIREIYGGDEFLKGTKRWCLWLVNAPPPLLRSSRLVTARLDGIRRFRAGSTRPRTRQLAATPALFGEIRQPDTNYLLVPKVSSERRNYIPMGFMEPLVIASGSALIVPNATMYHFGALSSAMHNSWIKGIGGRMKSDPQYSANLIYNNFPWPQDVTDRQRRRVEQAAQAVLDARDRFPDATLADLYDPNATPAALHRAHERLDRAVDACYRRRPFTSQRQRLEYLFGLYERLVAPLTATTRRRRPRRAL